MRDRSGGGAKNEDEDCSENGNGNGKGNISIHFVRLKYSTFVWLTVLQVVYLRSLSFIFDRSTCSFSFSPPSSSSLTVAVLILWRVDPKEGNLSGQLGKFSLRCCLFVRSFVYQQWNFESCCSSEPPVVVVVVVLASLLVEKQTTFSYKFYLLLTGSRRISIAFHCVSLSVYSSSLYLRPIQTDLRPCKRWESPTAIALAAVTTSTTIELIQLKLHVFTFQLELVWSNQNNSLEIRREMMESLPESEITCVNCSLEVTTQGEI